MAMKGDVSLTLGPRERNFGGPFSHLEREKFVDPHFHFDRESLERGTSNVLPLIWNPFGECELRERNFDGTSSQESASMESLHLERESFDPLVVFVFPNRENFEGIDVTIFLFLK
ncbi:hypothetical protein AMTRI_Chr09g12410 [Amborella trichopoda]